MEKHIGEVLNDRYMITEVVGVGGMAYVYKAFDRVCNRVVAVKILKDEFMSDAQFRRRFTNESKAITMLSHDNIVDVYDVSLESDSLYIVMEYIDGITLKEYISQKGILSDIEALHFVKQILNGLSHAHERGIVHRDIKPHNIILLKNGTIKITDFGIARLTKFDTQTISDQAIGSVHYISPEQASGDRTDERSDIYSVGIILFEMLTGKLPFEADTAVAVALMQVQSQPELPSDLNPDLNQGLEDITLKAIMKDPSVRYQSAGAVLADIALYEADPSIVFNYTAGEFEEPALVDDNSPTIFAPTIDANAVNGEVPFDAEMPSEGNEEEEDDGPVPFSKKFMKTGLPIIGGALSAVVVLAIVAVCVAFQLELFGAKPLACPNVIGLTVEEAEDKYGFEFEVSEKPSATAEEGEIFEQSPAEGEEIKKGGTIYVTVSTGLIGATTPETDVQNNDGTDEKTVPSIKEMSKADALTRLANAGYLSSEYTFDYIDDEDIEAGCVARIDIERASSNKTETNVDEGEKVYDGDKLVIYLSNGPQAVEVPDLIGMTESKAKKALSKAGLELGVITKEPNKAEKGEVFYQSKKAGAEVDKGTSIDISISTGSAEEDKPEVTKSVPSMSGMTKDQVTSALKNKDFKSGDYSFEEIESDSVAKGLFIKATVNGKEISAGYELSDGEKLVIYLSGGSATETDTNPDAGSDTNSGSDSSAANGENNAV